MADARNSLLAGGAIPSNLPPHTSVGHAQGPRRPQVSCCARAANWLVAPGGRFPGPCGHALGEKGDHLGMLRAPGLVPPGVEEFHSPCRRLLGAQVDQLLERVRRTRRLRRRRCRPGRAGAPVQGDGWPLLGHHPAKGDPEDEAVLPTHGVEECGGVVGEVRHGVDQGGTLLWPRPRWSYERTSKAWPTRPSASPGFWRRSPPVPGCSAVARRARQLVIQRDRCIVERHGSTVTTGPGRAHPGGKPMDPRAP